MKASVLTRVAAQSILKNKMRSLLTMLGIIIGVGAVILLVAIGQGAQSRIQEQIENLGTNMLVISPGSSSQGGVSRGMGSFNRLTVDDVEKLQRESFLLAAVSPVVSTGGQIVGGQGNWRTRINGVSVDYLAIRDWDVEFGRNFDASEVRSMKKVVLLGRTVAENLFPGQDPVGQQVRIRNVPFQIIGVLAEKGQTPEGSDMDDVILAPYSTVQTRLAGHQYIPQILASTFSPGDIPAAQAEIAAIMQESHGLASWEEDDFTVRNQSDLSEAAQGTTEVMTLLLAAIASISLLVGGIGIMNIMLVSVTERTREIGIRMSIGARGSDVMTQFLVESTVLSAAGGLLGLLLGLGGARIISSVTGWTTTISPLTVVVALAFSGAIGIFFGFYPARQAAELDPIEALRYE
ncbi:MAG: ABC transporter permease [Gemmatimonadetes bacterium]|jgi:putative ABC transport system permease protein|nr:ABC transporter permease [Gemmatimonadota bacterium]